MRPSNQTVAVTPSSYAEQASRRTPLILGALESGASVRWPLAGTPIAVSVTSGGKRIAVTPRAQTTRGAAAAIASAAVCAALDLDPGQLRIGTSPKVGARDAAVVAAAGLAGARRDPLVARSTLIGGLLPDGSVAGTPAVAAIDAAAAAGIKRLGIPAGTRSAYDPARKKRVDLVSHGAAAGVEVIEVVDLGAAYALMTGATLPQPRPVASEQMELGGDVDRRLEAAYQSWRQRLAPEWARVLQRGEGRLDAPERRLVSRLQRTVAAAEKEHAGGLAASALHRIQRAYALSRELARRSGRPVDEAERHAEIEVLSASIDEAIAAIRSDGFGTAGEVIGRVVRGRQLMRARALAAGAVAAGNAFFEREATARMLLAAAAGAVEIEGSWGAAAAMKPARAAAIARAHRRQASMLSTAGAAGDGFGDKRPGDPLLALAAARGQHLAAWIAVARAELLGIERHTGGAIGVSDPKALARLLELADEAARQSARAALIAAGAVPVTARIHYQSARALRAGDAVDQLEALELYWRSSWLSELAVLISRR